MSYETCLCLIIKQKSRSQNRRPIGQGKGVGRKHEECDILEGKRKDDINKKGMASFVLCYREIN